MNQLLPHLWCQRVAPFRPVQRNSKNAVVGKAHRLSLKPRPSPLKRPPTRRVVGVSAPSCTWPLGHPGDAGFHFCGKRPVQGKPYCTEHAAMAYVAPKKTNAA